MPAVPPGHRPTDSAIERWPPAIFLDRDRSWQDNVWPAGFASPLQPMPAGFAKKSKGKLRPEHFLLARAGAFRGGAAIRDRSDIGPALAGRDPWLRRSDSA